jgi:predicted acylesterase/phospholipase RssA
VDLGFLIEHVARRLKPLATDRVLASASPLTVIATDVEAASMAVLRDFGDADGLFAAMRAGATMPIVAGPPVTYAGRTYLDASLTQPIPVPAAEADGFTHILVLLTRPTDGGPGASVLDRWYVLPSCGAFHPAWPRSMPIAASPMRPCSAISPRAADHQVARASSESGRPHLRSAGWSGMPRSSKRRRSEGLRRSWTRFRT